MSKNFPGRKNLRAILGAIFVILASEQSSLAYENRFETHLRLEAKFKNICTTLLDILSQDPPDKTWGEKIITYRWQLKSFAETHPESIWADDAQYIFALLDASEGMLVPELEYLLVHFPNAEAEPWPRQTLPFIPEESPLDLSVRKELCINYFNLKEKRKLRHIVKTSIQKYPDQAEIFQSFLDQLEQASEDESSKKRAALLRFFSPTAMDRDPLFPMKAERR